MKSIRLYFYALLAMFMPATRMFSLKRSLLRWAGASIGENARVVSSARFYTTGRLEIGDDTWIGHEVLIIGGNASVVLGANCDIAPRVTFVSGTHEVDFEGEHIAGKGYSLPIEVGNGCWIGTSAVVLGGTTVGHNSIVAAGAVVRGEYPPYSLIGGVPARLIKCLRA